MSITNRVPANWITTTLGAVGDLICGQSPASSEVNATGMGVPYVSGPDQWDGTTVAMTKWTTRPRRQVPAGCIFITVKGAGVGTVFRGVPCVIGRDIYAYKPSDLLSSRFIEHAIRFTVSFLLHHVVGDIPGLSKRHILEHGVAVPPAEEQRRIVQKIEELFSELEAGITTLRRVQANLKRYRAAVLKAAVEGRLTEEWRREHPDVESASVLLERITRGQRKREEEQFATRDLPPLPKGWCWARVAKVGEVRLGRQRSPAHHKGPHMRPYLRVANVFEDRIDVTDVMYMNFTPEEYETYHLKYGDILLNEGQSLELLGRPAMYREELTAACFTNTLIRFRTQSGVLPEFALAVFLTYLHIRRYQRIGRFTTNIAHLGAGRFSDVEFPLPPTEEQAKIVAEIDRRLSVVDQMAKQVNVGLRRAARLRQSILNRAFQGKLARQNPSDEPASVLLERIARERIGLMPHGSARKPRRARNTTPGTAELVL